MMCDHGSPVHEALHETHKQDFINAEAIAEADERKNMRLVPLETAHPLNLQASYRVRDRLVSRRTAAINQIRTLLLEGA